MRDHDSGRRTVLRPRPGHRADRPSGPDEFQGSGRAGRPAASAFAAAPATFNTINKWAAGISDTLALGLLNEATGQGLPIVTVPWPNAALARHPAFGRSVATLRGCGITVIFDPAHLPDDEAPGQAEFPWADLRAELARMRTAVGGGYASA